LAGYRPSQSNAFSIAITFHYQARRVLCVTVQWPSRSKRVRKAPVLRRKLRGKFTDSVISNRQLFQAPAFGGDVLARGSKFQRKRVANRR
jgi:hypothetical protein